MDNFTRRSFISLGYFSMIEQSNAGHMVLSGILSDSQAWSVP
jgi:hypothetical protein